MIQQRVNQLFQGKPFADVQVQVTRVDDSFHKRDQATSPKSDNQHSPERRDFNGQTTSKRESKDAYTESRSLSSEKRHNQSFGDLPATQSILPVAILERPALEDDSFQDSRVNL